MRRIVTTNTHPNPAKPVRNPGQALRLAFYAAALTLLAAASAHAQGLIIDRRIEIRTIQPCEVRDLTVDANIKDQVAEVQVTQLFHNPSPVEMEAQLLFPLPEDGAIQNFVLMVDGKEIPGKIMARDEARRTYEDIVRRRRDPALLEFAGLGLYQTSVFPIPAGADRKITMKYTNILKRENSAVEFVYPLAAQRVANRPLPHLAVNLHIQSGEAIKSIYSPSSDIRIDRSGDHEARVSFDAHNPSVASDFRIVYTLEKGPVGASVLSWRPEKADDGAGQQDGYFLLLASPEVKADDKPIAKNVIFVLDRSGSMASDQKIEKARSALSYVLENLHDDDLFNIVVFDDQVETYKPELQRMTKESRAAAQTYASNIRPGGSTNIDEALHAALGMINDDSRPSYIIFMTDGLPTVGERNENNIADHVKKENTHHAHIFTFGVGSDLNARLLDRISGGNGGTTEFIKGGEELESKVSSFYQKMSSPVMTNIKLTMDGVDMNRVYPRDLPDLFAGGQMVIVGRYAQSKDTTLRLTGRVGDRDQTIETHLTLASPGDGRSNEYVERVWAARRIGNILDEIDMNGQNQELVDELVSLSKHYGILTPYTSFLAMEDTLPPQNGPLFRPNAQPMPGFRGGRGRGGVGGAGGGGGAGAMGRANDFGMDGSINLDRSSIGGAGRGGRGGGGGGRRGAIAQPADSLALRLADPNSTSGIQDREFKAQLQTADKPLAGAEQAKVLRSSMPPASTSAGASATRDEASAKDAKAQTIRQIGAKTFYLKQGVWIDSALKDEDVAKAVKIEQFSDDYFKLIDGLSGENLKYLSFREPVTVRIKDKIYRIDPPAKP